jgi:[ribosomal protein S18]-alanine N-acetyltransferase
MEVRIRRMRLEDLEQVHAIDVLSFRLPWSERSFRYELTGNQASRLWVAEITDPSGQTVVVGQVAIWLIIDEAHIGTIAIHPDYRRQGIGRKLLAEALLSIEKEGAKQAFLEVRRSNESAQAMYQKFGFEVVGVRPRYYKDNNEDALLLTLPELRPEELERLVKDETGSM